MTENRSPHEPATSYTARVAQAPAMRKLMALAAQYGPGDSDERDADERRIDHAEDQRRSHQDSLRR